MPKTDRYVARANHILRDLDSVFPGHTPTRGKFQLCWSEDLYSIVPQYEDKGSGQIEPIMETHCHCGVDVRVHAASCARTLISKVKMQRVSMFGMHGEYQSYSNVWVLCRWNPPPTLDDWTFQMGTDSDYPKEGRYLPVSKGPYLVVVPRRTVPEDLPECAQLMVHLLREQFQTMDAQRAKQKERNEMLRIPIEDAKGNVIREPHKDAPFWRIAERVKEKMRLFNRTGTVGYTGALKESSNA